MNWNVDLRSALYGLLSNMIICYGMSMVLQTAVTLTIIQAVSYIQVRHFFFTLGLRGMSMGCARAVKLQFPSRPDACQRCELSCAQKKAKYHVLLCNFFPGRFQDKFEKTSHCVER